MELRYFVIQIANRNKLRIVARLRGSLYSPEVATYPVRCRLRLSLWGTNGRGAPQGGAERAIKRGFLLPHT